ncbi:hypothetical protein [Xanthomonas phage DES1]|nr:hypothetical protein [Xanthomonas phage DES1]
MCVCLTHSFRGFRVVLRTDTSQEEAKMRKIEQQMIKAIKKGKDWTSGNTKVINMGNITNVYLHGHMIAIAHPNHGTLEISLAGWNTVTTRSRLSALIREFAALGPDGLGVSTKQGQPRLHDAMGMRNIDSTGWHEVALRH